MACYMLLVEWWSGYHEDWSLCSPHLLTWLPALLARQWVSPGCSSDLGGLYWLSPSHIDFHPPQPLCSHLDFHPHSIDFHAHVKRRKRQNPRIRARIRKRHHHLARTPSKHRWWHLFDSPRQPAQIPLWTLLYSVRNAHEWAHPYAGTAFGDTGLHNL